MRSLSPIPKPNLILEVSPHIDDERGNYPSAGQDGGMKMKTGLYSLDPSEGAVADRRTTTTRMSELEDGNRNENLI